MKTWKKAVLGLMAAAGIAGAAGIGVQGHKRQKTLEGICQLNGINASVLKNSDLKQVFLDKGFIYEPKPWNEFSDEPRCFLKLEKKDGDVLVGTSYGPNLRGIRGKGFDGAYGLTTKDGRRVIIDVFPISYDSMESGYFNCNKSDGRLDTLVLCRFLEGVDSKDERVNKIYYELIKLAEIHEKQHQSDIASGKYSVFESEVRARCRELMESPLAFLGLESKKSIVQPVAKVIFDSFDCYDGRTEDGKRFGHCLGIRDKKEIVTLPQEKLRDHIRGYIKAVYGEKW